MLYQTKGTALDFDGARQDFIVVSDVDEALTHGELQRRVNDAVRRSLGSLKEVAIKEAIPMTGESDLVILTGGLYGESWKRPGKSGIDHVPVSG